jgi:hypothetical protein
MTLGSDIFTEDWNGRIANVKIWNTNIGVTQLWAEMWSTLPVRWANINGYYPMLDTATGAIDYSGNGYDWTVAGTVATEGGPPLGPTFAFDQYTGETLVAAAAGETVNATLQDSLSFSDQNERDGIFTR